MSAASGEPGHGYRVVASHERFTGTVFSVFSDEVVMPGGGTATRDYARHLGAVGVVAVDSHDRVVLIRQYRHPMRRYLWELPAGLVDVAGEAGVQTAARELAEEADLTAAHWDLLVDLDTSPGYSNERIRVFLARGLSPVPADSQHSRVHEEAEIVVDRVDLDEAVAMALRGEITNATAVAGLLAAAWGRDQGWATLRPASTSTA